jgi:hypothetical protein
MICGIVLLLHCLFQGDALNGLFITAIVVATFLAPYVHSYLTWKRTIAAGAS